MNPTLRRAFGTVAAGVALTGSLAVAPLAAGAAEDASPTAPVTAQANAARTQAENDRIVDAMYEGFLKRPATTAEIAASRQLATDGDFKAIVTKVSRGDEWLGVFVDDLYNQALEREPDTAGRTYWIGELAKGNSSTLIAASVIGSAEFRTLAGNTDDGFIERNYVRILSRASEPAGKTFWLGVLASTGDDKIGADFFESEENRKRRVTNQYDQLLCRAPETAGLNFWADVITGGNDVLLSEELATSTEFIANAVAGRCLSLISDPDPDPGPPVAAEICTGVTTMPNDDCQALVKIYNANGGSGWVAVGTGGSALDYPGTWAKQTDPCTWAGVECAAGKLTALSLNAAGVTGAVDASLADLTDLVTLNLSGNAITSLPTGFASMTGLRFVNIAYNDLTASGAVADLTSAPAINVLTATQAGLSTLDVSGIAELQELYINNDPSNQVDGTKNTFTALPLPTATDSLRILEAQYNSIASIAGVQAHTLLGTDDGPSNGHLWLFNNKIPSVPAGIEALTGLAADPTPAVSTDNAGNDFRLGPQCVGSAPTAADGTGATFMDGRDGGPSGNEGWKSTASGAAACQS